MKTPPEAKKDQTGDHPSQSFELGVSLSYYDGKEMAETVFYKGASPESTSHTIRQHDGTLLTVHDSYLCIKLQPDLSNTLSTPLDPRNEVYVGIYKEEAQALVRPHILTPIQQELMDWYHRLYHFYFPKIFRLAELGHLPKRLLDCKNNAPLCVACQFGTAHCRP